MSRGVLPNRAAVESRWARTGFWLMGWAGIAALAVYSHEWNPVLATGHENGSLTASRSVRPTALTIVSGTVPHAMALPLSGNPLAPMESIPSPSVLKLLADDAHDGDAHGAAVAVSGNCVVAGAYRAGEGRGAVYIWEPDEAGTGNWNQVIRLTIPDGREQEWFGYAVAVSGDMVAAGAYGFRSGAGTVYLFAQDPGDRHGWDLVKSLTASDGGAGDRFGSSLALSGDMLLIGAPGHDAYQGTAYLYERNHGGTNQWGEVKKLTASEGEGGDRFGIAVAIDGDTAVIGSDGKNDFTGGVCVFERNVWGENQWGRLQQLKPDNLKPHDFFGSSVAVQGNTLLIGAPGDDDPASDGGAVYVYTRGDDPVEPWRPAQKLTATGGGEDERFGSATAVYEDLLLIGAQWNNSRGEYAGAAYVFEPAAGTGRSWRPFKKLTPFDGQEQDRFGHAVALSGAFAVIGTHRGDYDPGAVYLMPNTNQPILNVTQDRLVLDEDTQSNALAFTVISPEGANPRVRAVSSDPVLIPDENLRLTHLGQGQWELIVTPAAGRFGGPVTVTLEADDGQGGTGQAVVTIQVNDVNDAPAIVEPDPVPVVMDQNGYPLGFSLTLHAEDVDGDPLTWRILVPANHGVARVNGTGYAKAIRYTPVYNFSGQDRFTVQAGDGRGGIDTRTIQVTIRPRSETTTGQTNPPGTGSPTPTGPANGSGTATPTFTDGGVVPARTPDLPPSTPVPTPTPTPTPTPSPVVVPIPVDSVEVFDDEADTAPLTGITDFDTVSDRRLTLRWNYSGGWTVTDWHVYVRQGDGGFFYLGRTGNGDSRMFVWTRPDFNSQYQFRVWGLYKNDSGQNRTVVLSQSGPMGYNLAGGHTITLQNISNPDDLAPGTVRITDDLYHNQDLRGGTDRDSEIERALVLKFNPGAGDYTNAHVQVSTNGKDFEYLGQTGSGNLGYFRFDANGSFALAVPWNAGPQNNTTYWFRVIAFPSGGGPVTMETGPVLYQVEPPAESPTPAAVEAYDDEHSREPLTGRTDFDDPADRKLSIRWHWDGAEPVTDWHVYVRKGSGGYGFLGRTGNGEARMLNWLSPEINAQYQFRVWGLYKNDRGEDRLVVLSQAGPMGYTLENSQAVTLKMVSNPTDVAPGQAIVVDDLLHGTDLSGQEDEDTPLERALVLKWNPGEGTFINTHILAGTDGLNYSYLGQTGAEDIQYFRFDANGTFAESGDWKKGPQNQTTYWFRIVALREKGKPVTLNAGPVRFKMKE
ncbi:MAG: Ig-like domain-containing protein [bacterium]